MKSALSTSSWATANAVSISARPMRLSTSGVKAGLSRSYSRAFILGVGELLAEREQGITEEIVSLQTKIALQGVSADEAEATSSSLDEPVWAIGTGRDLLPPSRSVRGSAESSAASKVEGILSK